MKLSSTHGMTRVMTAEQFLALAEALRSFALRSGRDLNASNLFVHTMLMRMLRSEAAEAPVRDKRDVEEAA